MRIYVTLFFVRDYDETYDLRFQDVRSLIRIELEGSRSYGRGDPSRLTGDTAVNALYTSRVLDHPPIRWSLRVVAQEKEVRAKV